MGVEFASERRLLTEDELQPVLRSHYPQLSELERDDVIDLARWLRQQRARARDIIYERRRLRRGKGAPRSTASGDASERGLAAKKQVFARALKRVNHHIAALDAESKRALAVANLNAALARRRATPVHHPESGHTANRGMRSQPSSRRPGIISGGRIGSVSQAGKVSQAKSDGGS
jgi:hypothetical protein